MDGWEVVYTKWESMLYQFGFVVKIPSTNTRLGDLDMISPDSCLGKDLTWVFAAKSSAREIVGDTLADLVTAVEMVLEEW